MDYPPSFEAYGGALIPGFLRTIPNASTLDGNWHVHMENARPSVAFQKMGYFIKNLTDAQLCYGRLSLTTDHQSISNSTVSFWYQGVIQDQVHELN